MATQLPKLPEITKLSSRVIRILAGNPGKFTLQGTNTYLVGTGRQRLLIDSGDGLPSWIKNLQDVLKQENASIETALISHWHHDHVGGIQQLRDNYPGIKIHKMDPEDGLLDIADGDKFSVEGATLRAVHSPGHTTDHIAFVLEEENAMFTADNVLGHGTAVFEDLKSYISSLKKMETLFAGRAYPGHGEIIDDGKAKILEYIKHRQLREDQVVDVLRSPNPAADEPGSKRNSNEWTSMEIVKVIYKDVPENLHIPAQGGIMQVLLKLLDEGKVLENETDDDSLWSLQQKASL